MKVIYKNIIYFRVSLQKDSKSTKTPKPTFLNTCTKKKKKRKQQLHWTGFTFPGERKLNEVNKDI